MRLYTRENAWHLNMEDRLGTIEPGKLADLVVLDKDFLDLHRRGAQAHEARHDDRRRQRRLRGLRGGAWTLTDRPTRRGATGRGSRGSFVVGAPPPARRSASVARARRSARVKAPATPKSGPGKHVEDDALLFIKGRIHTMDGSNRIVEEARIENGKFVEVGDSRPGQGEGDQPPGHGRSSRGSSSRTSTSSASPTGPATTSRSRTRRSIAEVQALLAARRPDVPDGSSSPRWAASTSTVGRAPPADARRARRRGLRPAGVHVPELHRPGGDEQPRQGVLRDRLRRRSPARSSSAPTARSRTGTTRRPRALYHLRVRQTYEDRLRSTIDAMDYAASQGMTAMLDQVLFPVAGPADAEPGAVEPRRLPHVRLVARPAPPGQDDRAAADQLPAQPGLHRRPRPRR